MSSGQRTRPQARSGEARPEWSVRRAMSRLLVVLALMAGATIGTVSFAPTAHAAQRWFDGSIQYSNIVNCSSIIGGYPYQEKGAAAYTGYLTDPEASQPSPGTVFYVHVVVTILGANCSGQYADVNVQLPAGTSLAISASNPVVCAYNGSPVSINECPQSLPSAPAYGAGYLNVPSISSPSPQIWPIANGNSLAIAIPITSSTALSGVPLNAKVKMFDGNDSPVLSPTQNVFVFSGTPTIVPKNPNTTFGGTQWPTTVRSESYVYSGSQAGNAFFDLRTTPGGSPVQTDGPVPIAAGGGYLVWDDFTPFASASMAANTTYYWQLRYVTTAGVTYTGPEQSFTTPAANTATVGTGTPASCTGAAVAAAAATASASIVFDCGPAPVTIQMVSTISLSNRVIDGGGLVTLLAPPNSKHFQVLARSTIQSLTLTGGNTQSCGGSVELGAPATISSVKFIANTTTFNDGGALCVRVGTTATVDSSVFIGNSAASGGAIVNAGTLLMTNSTVSGNSGGIGGGIVSRLGTVNISHSTISQNTATANGGGVAASATDLTVETSTVSGNSADSGGGVSANAGSLKIISSTIANNRATLPGRAGGVSSQGATLTGFLTNNILSNNTGPAGSANCATDVTYRVVPSFGWNLDSGTTCGLTGTGDLSSTDPKLLPLALWRGTTRTHALAFDSPAIDKGESGSSCSGTDQTGFFVAGIRTSNRIVDGDGSGTKECDMGAYEFAPARFLPEPDRSTPTVKAIGRTSANPTTAATVQWVVTFSETVTGVDAADFLFAASGVSGASIASFTPS